MMNSHAVKIGGKSVPLRWDQATSRRFRLRASSLGLDPARLFADLSDTVRAEYSAAALTWLLLPSSAHYRTPEDMWEHVEEADIADNLKALVGVFEDMSPDAEKKSTSKNSRLRGSS